LFGTQGTHSDVTNIEIFSAEVLSFCQYAVALRSIILEGRDKEFFKILMGETEKETRE
jgi:hypothetical protein